MSRRFLVGISLVALFVPTACSRSGSEPPPLADPTSLRSTSQGSVIGFEADSGAHVWRGIPFAEPPTGDLRWRAPRPPQPFTETLEALEFGASCVQFASPAGGVRGEAAGAPSGSEDCLYLNVFAPRYESKAVPRGAARLPVMLWIHGGGNTVGDALLYDFGKLAVAHDLVVVTVHYRLGAFGWFSHPALRARGTTPDDGSGNYGTLDLVRALGWVRDHITAFGGNPNRVTIFGESAGGSNVFSLLLTPRARGLFQGAIVESGSLRTDTRARAENLVDAHDPGDENSSGEIVLKRLVAAGQAADREAAIPAAAALGAEEIAKLLRDTPAYELLSLYGDGGFGGMYPAPELIRDGAVLPAGNPLEALRAGRYNQVPVVLGTNRDENKTFMLFSSDAVTRVLGIPLWLNDERLYDLSTRYASLFWKLRGVDAPAAAMRGVQGASVYGYRFDWDEEPKLLWLDFSKLLGAAHGLEMPFVMGTLDLGIANRFFLDDARRPAAEVLSRQMQSYWAEFAYTGDPGRGRLGDQTAWLPWSTESANAPKFLVLDTEADGGVRMSSDSVTNAGLMTAIAEDTGFASWQERCAVFHRLVTRSRMTEEEYEGVGDGGCAAYPLDAYPWEG